MSEVRIGPTNDRSVVGVMNEFAFHGEFVWKRGLRSRGALPPHAAAIAGPLHATAGSPDQKLAPWSAPNRSHRDRLAGPTSPQPRSARARQRVPAQGHVARDKPPIWRRVLVDGAARSTSSTRSSRRRSGGGTTTCTSSRSGATDTAIPDPDEDWASHRGTNGAPASMRSPGTGHRSHYTYDFGDGWDHRVVVEKVFPRGRTARLRRASTADAPAHPKIAADRGATGSCSRSSPTPPIPNTTREPEWASAWGGSGLDPEAFDPSTSSPTTCEPSTSPPSTTEPRPVPLTEPVPRSAPASVRQAGGWRDAARRLPDRVPRGLRGGRCYVPSCPRRCR